MNTFTIDVYSITCVDGELRTEHFIEEFDPEDRFMELEDISRRLSIPRGSSTKSRVRALVNDWNRKAMIGWQSSDRIWHYVLR